MKFYDVYYDEPKIVRILAKSEKEARELFISGEWDGEINDKTGVISEPKSILLMANDTKPIGR